MGFQSVREYVFSFAPVSAGHDGVYHLFWDSVEVGLQPDKDSVHFALKIFDQSVFPLGAFVLKLQFAKFLLRDERVRFLLALFQFRYALGFRQQRGLEPLVEVVRDSVFRLQSLADKFL